MANPAVTYIFVNGQTSDGTQVSQNFSDIIAALTDGTKTLTISGLVIGTSLILTGVTDGSSASAGAVGEALTAFSGGGVSPSFVSGGVSGAWADVASITLTAGDWNLWASGETRQNAVTGLTAMLFGIGTATGNSSTGLSSGQNNFGLAAFPTTNVDSQFHIPPQIIRISGSTTFYLKQNYTFSTGTPEARGTMWARRIR